MIGVVDTSVFSGHWPFQLFAQHCLPELKAYLQSNGACQAWVASAEAILYPDPMYGNTPLLKDTQYDPFFVPVAVIDPTLATWEYDARQCLQLGCRAFKLTPNYHSYSLDCDSVQGLVTLAHTCNVPICIQIRMMDERSHHPLMQVPAVRVADLGELAKRFPDNRFLVCAAFHTELSKLAGLPNVWVEISNVESKEALVNAVKVFGPNNLVFGSHSPFLTYTAVTAKLATDPLTCPLTIIQAITQTNACTLLTGRPEP